MGFNISCMVPTPSALRGSSGAGRAAFSSLQPNRTCGAPEGFTVIELLIAMSMLGIVAAIALPQYRAAQVQIKAAQQLVIATLRGARASALTKSVHFAVEFASSRQLVVERLQEVDTVWQVDTSDVHSIPLPPVTQFADTVVGTRVEFNSHGEAVNLTGPQQIDLFDSFGATTSVQAWPSGQVNDL